MIGWVRSHGRSGLLGEENDLMRRTSAIHSGPMRTAEDLYLDLLARCLTRELFIDEEVYDVGRLGRKGAPIRLLTRLLSGAGYRVVRTGGCPVPRRVGLDLPPKAEIMRG